MATAAQEIPESWVDDAGALDRLGLRCLACTGILREPVSPACGHCVCRACASNTCAACGCAGPFDANAVAARLIDDLRVHCDQCGHWAGVAAGLSRHRATCVGGRLREDFKVQRRLGGGGFMAQFYAKRARREVRCVAHVDAPTAANVDAPEPVHLLEPATEPARPEPPVQEPIRPKTPEPAPLAHVDPPPVEDAALPPAVPPVEQVAPPPPPAPKPAPVAVAPTLLLTDKYSAFYVGQPAVLNAVTEFVTRRLAQPMVGDGEQPTLVLEGPSGCGKLTAVRHVARLKNLQVRVVGAGEFSEKIGAQLRDVVSSRDAFTRQRPVVVFAGLDAWEGPMQSAAFDLFRVLAGVKVAPGKKKRPRAAPAQPSSVKLALRQCNPVIVTTGDRYWRERKSLVKLTTFVKVAPPDPKQLAMMLTKLSARLNVPMPAEAQRQLIACANGDVRYMITQLELWQSGARTRKDTVDMLYFDLVDYLFKTRDAGPPERLDQAVDHDMLLPAVAENYALAYEDNTVENMARASLAADALSDCCMTDVPTGSFGTRDALVCLLRQQPRKFRRYNFPGRMRVESEIETKAAHLRASATSYGHPIQSTWDAREPLGYFAFEWQLPFLNDGDAATSRKLRSHFVLET